MRSLKQLLIIVAIVLFTTQFSIAQKFSEIGIGIGTFLYQGDMTPTFPVGEEFTFAGNIFYRYNFNSAIAVKAQFSFGQISGNDIHGNNRRRNMKFRSLIGELAITGQVDIIALIRRDGILGNFTPFIYGGVAGFYFNPQGKYEGEWHDLQPLGTEGQGMAEYPNKDPYSLFQVSIPFGIDLRYNFSRQFFTGLEFGMRKTFTDYLDDVSGTYADNELIQTQKGDMAAYLADPRDVKKSEGEVRGNSARKDWYSHFNVYFTYNIIGKRDWRKIKKRSF
ncbi:MAG: hypothetical protein ACI94Y_000679 [Maribacter sp.]|jgi:hypothetical protein